MDLSRLEWRKSSFSGNPQGDCVEIARDGQHTLMRDSKNPANGVLTFSTSTFQEFIQGVRAGEFD